MAALLPIIRSLHNAPRPDHCPGRGRFLQIDGGVHAVDIPLVQLPAQQLNGLTKPLEMDDLPFPEEFDDIIDVRIVAQAQDVVIGDPGLLLWHAAKSTTIEN